MDDDPPPRSRRDDSRRAGSPDSRIASRAEERHRRGLCELVPSRHAPEERVNLRPRRPSHPDRGEGRSHRRDEDAFEDDSLEDDRRRSRRYDDHREQRSPPRREALGGGRHRRRHEDVDDFRDECAENADTSAPPKHLRHEAADRRKGEAGDEQGQPRRERGRGKGTDAGPRRKRRRSPSRAEAEFAAETERISILHSDCSKVIGKGGRMLREVERRSGAHVQVQREEDMDRQTKLRAVEIIGMQEERKVAKKLLLELVSFCRDSNGDVLKEAPERATQATLTLEVQVNEVGKILGRKGETIQRLEQKSGCRIDVGKDIGLVEIQGDQEARDKCLELVLQEVSFAKTPDGTILKDERKLAEKAADGDKDAAEKKSESTLALEVLAGEIGKILGRKGETIQRLEQTSGCRIDVVKESGLVEIQGDQEARDKCLDLVLQEVSFAKAVDGTILKDERKQPPSAEEKAVEGEKASLPPTRLFVTDREAGRVIGRRGETIRQIMEASCAGLKLQKSDDMRPGRREREIMVFGQQHQQDKAKEMILELVSWCRDDGGVLKDTRPPEEEDQMKAITDGTEPSTQTGDAKEDADGSGGQGSGDGGNRSKGDGKGKDKGSRRKLAAWVCAKCGGDHRTKDCDMGAPGNVGPWGMALQMGMSMGMHMGMMGGPMMPGMGMMPGMMGGKGMPMPGMPPGMMPPWMQPGMDGRPSGKKRNAGAALAQAESGDDSSSDSSSSEEEAAVAPPQVPPRKHPRSAGDDVEDMRRRR